jgi:DNA mismatch endonuclease (patch repair protein)
VKPDFVLPRSTGSGIRRTKPIAVFVDGCFWHGCPKHATQPKTNAKFWRDKIAGNRARDRRVNSALRKRDWTVLRIWEHELTGRNRPRLLRRLLPLLPPPGHL